MRDRRRAAGFVITLEFLLVMALFVMPVLVGLIILGRKYVTLYLNRQESNNQFYSKPVVWDSSLPDARAIGPVVGYDAFEAPLVVFRDETTGDGVVLGVRTDRFTSYGQVFYSDANCSLDPRIRIPLDSVATGTNVYPPNGFLYQMQGRSHAMGSGNILYRMTETPPADVTSAGDLYVWISQDIADPAVIPLAPCYAVPPGVTVENLVDAMPVIDFDDTITQENYRPPFRVAFPTPSAAPPLPAGE